MPRKPKNVVSKKARKTPLGRPRIGVKNGGLVALNIRVTAKWHAWATEKAKISGKSVSELARKLLGDDDTLGWIFTDSELTDPPR